MSKLCSNLCEWLIVAHNTYHWSMEVFQCPNSVASNVDVIFQHTEQEIACVEELKDELELAHCEVQSLKQLMYGKDYLVTQKTKALDLSKVNITRTNSVWCPGHPGTIELEPIPHMCIVVGGNL